jgi:hypothetical protein
MYVTRDTSDYFQYRFEDIDEYIKSNYISNDIKTNIKILQDNINIHKANTNSIIKSVVLIKYLRKLFDNKLGITKSDIDYFNYIIRTNKYEYTTMVRIIKLVSFVIEKYVRFEHENMNNDYLQYNYQEKNYNIDILDIMFAFYMFDKYNKKYKKITTVILLNDESFVSILKNYLNYKNKPVTTELIDELSNSHINDITKDDENNFKTLINTDFSNYCLSYNFVKDINRKYDNIFNVKTIFKNNNVFNIIKITKTISNMKHINSYVNNINNNNDNDNYRYNNIVNEINIDTDSDVDSDDNDDLDIIVNESDSDNFDIDVSSTNIMSNDYNNEEYEKLDEDLEEEYTKKDYEYVNNSDIDDDEV